MSKVTYEELDALLEKIAAIAHFGGLVNMSAQDALFAIRSLTLDEHFGRLNTKAEEYIKSVIEKGRTV